MRYDSEKHQRRSIRLKGYDFAQSYPRNRLVYPARPSGNATITNTSSPMRNKYIVDNPQRWVFDREKSGFKT